MANASEHLPLSNTVLIPVGPLSNGCCKGDTDCGSDEGISGGTRVYLLAFGIEKFETSMAVVME